MLRESRMSPGVVWMLLASLALASGREKAYSGFLGCKFSDAVCNQDETCVDDRLFGSCQSVYDSPDPYQYALDEGQLSDLEAALSALLAADYTWDSLYTQCTLGNLLLAFRTGTAADPAFCGPPSPARTRDLDLEAELTAETLRLLNKYFEDYYDYAPKSAEPREQDVDTVDVEPEVSQEYPDTYSSETIWEPYAKKDEFVSVHKYLKSHKRDPLYSGEREALPLSQERDYPAEEPDLDYDALIQSLTPDDLSLLQRFLDGAGQDVADQDYATDYADYTGSEAGARGMLGDEAEKEEADSHWLDEPIDSDLQVKPLSAPNEAVSTDEILQPDAENMVPAQPDPETMVLGEPDAENMVPETPEQMPAFMEMNNNDAALIGDLLQGRERVKELPRPEIERLSRYVDSMLRTLETLRSEEGQSADLQDGGALEEVLLPAAEEKLLAEVNKKGGVSDLENNPAWQVVVAQKKASVSEERAAADPHDLDEPTTTANPKYGFVDGNFAYLQVQPKEISLPDAQGLVTDLEALLDLPPQTLTDVSVNTGEVGFRVNENAKGLNASAVDELTMSLAEELHNRTGYKVLFAGIGRGTQKVGIEEVQNNGPKYFVLTFVLCGCIAGLVLAGIALYVVRRHSRSRSKLAQLGAGPAGADPAGEASKDYQDLCRQRMQSKSSEKPEPLHVAARVGSTGEQSVRSPSSRSSTSSWSEEPVQSNMDISTGHVVLSYMEDHLKNKDRLTEEWDGLCAYEAEPNSTGVAAETGNMRKNRYTDLLPYDHSRVVLSTETNVAGSDYINASTITDHDPRSPAYIASQGPLPHTVADFWQMVWEQGSVVIVSLTKLTENGNAMCHRYWPEEGSDLYHIYEVHLVSEHIWCPEYLVRSFYLKNLATNETRTVTQFHFLAWPDLAVPDSGTQGLKALLDFRRKVNKSYRGRSCPILVHCNDGAGRSGAYCLIDMVLNRMSKGAKEIDIAATLEHIRDQRMQMVKTKEQFEFVLAAVAEEVHAILKALPQ